LTSSAWKARIIPRHSQYRVIRIREDMPHLWAHLAKRSDLARTITAVHICEDLDFSSPQIYPTTFVNKVPVRGPPYKVEERKVRNMCQALRHMTRLKEFAWSLNYSAFPTTQAVYEDAIFLALCQCKSLLHLALWGRFAERAPGVDRDPGGIYCALWRLSNLETLTINGNAWVRPTNAPHIFAMLKRSPRLQSLTFPMEFSALADCHFPCLRKLVLTLQAGTTSRIDASRARFIEAHPTIEDLQWFPVSSVTLTPGSLPALRRLSTTAQLALSILSDQTDPPRPLEYIHGLYVNPETISGLEGVHGGTLRELRIAQYDDLQSLSKLAELFPALTSLETPSYATLPDGVGIRRFAPDDWFPVLSRFPNLEIFSGYGLWTMIDRAALNVSRMEDTILKLAELCPKLRELECWAVDDNGDDCKQIIISREGKEVKWKIQAPPSCFGFDSIMDEYK